MEADRYLLCLLSLRVHGGQLIPPSHGSFRFIRENIRILKRTLGISRWFNGGCRTTLYQSPMTLLAMKFVCRLAAMIEGRYTSGITNPRPMRARNLHITIATSSLRASRNSWMGFMNRSVAARHGIRLFLIR